MSGKDANHVSPTPSHTPQHQDHSSHEILGTPDRVKFNDETTSYTSSGHWTSILDGVRLFLCDCIPSAEHAIDFGIA